MLDSWHERAAVADTSYFDLFSGVISECLSAACRLQLQGWMHAARQAAARIICRVFMGFMDFTDFAEKRKNSL